MMSQPSNTAVLQAHPSSVRVTTRALQRVRELIEEEGNPSLKLRVSVTGGGCSGFQYDFSVDEAMADDDMVLEYDDVSVVVDALSFPYLLGSEVDYSDGVEGSRFMVHNPNATATCGCGTSFSV